MRRITVLNGSVNRKGNTQYFIEEILRGIPKEIDRQFFFASDYMFPLVYKGLYDPEYSRKVAGDNIYSLQESILESNLLIIASPVYMHNISSNLKLVIEKLSTWSHILRLDGKPVVVLSTCSTNGDTTVTSYLCKVISTMGGNIIANCNANGFQLHDEVWLNDVTNKIRSKIICSIGNSLQSNYYIEEVFKGMKLIMNDRIGSDVPNSFAEEESTYWVKSGLINYDSFQKFLDDKYNLK
ncbi:hypothetical protein LG045_07935 [Limosilactobacillus gastricus]|uniref:NADPH-dependent FMN reductase-like domain-containing protein n=1 Tax=Limosilactobacillus gastricus DSM 16045 TaxID=1423749 RepID=A0A0R1V5F6_9LACO|nr:NAD(P)H-dependent oxidoreductase [Limosilactobacillus gastricus]KRM00752.1 hypothetical protein FC60_GL001034 [Limosilactobacillus gastricus DSM 16045]QGF40975.1 hypothetical protein LG045_07935 [Limosilactobacillus gastricus]